MRIVALILASALLLEACGRKDETAVVREPSAPPEVMVAEATEATRPGFKDAIATLAGSAETPVLAPVMGYLIKQTFEEGASVKAGQVLFVINTKPFQGSVDGQKASDSITAKIAAPADGVAGKVNPGLGDLIKPGVTLTTISTTDPIEAEFALPEKYYQDNAEELNGIAAKRLEDRPENFELVLADGTVYPRKGKLADIGKKTPAATGVITVHALFPNPDGLLQPGQFARVRGLKQTGGEGVVIPQEAVSELQGIAQVMVVTGDNTVEIRRVGLGGSMGEGRVITSGLREGERVIVGGARQYDSGAKVNPQPYVAPSEIGH